MSLRSVSEPLQSGPLPDYSCLGLATTQTLLTLLRHNAYPAH